MSKFEERTIRDFLITYKENSQTVFAAETGKFWRSINVIFIENKVYKDVYKKHSEKLLLEHGKEKRTCK